MLRQLAFTQMGERSSHDWKDRGNKFYHGQRVAKLALLLRKDLFPQETQMDDLLTVAAWFHDVCNGLSDHAQAGADLVRSLLRDLLSPAELAQVCAIIAVHDDRRAGQEASVWVQLHQDADLLDHFGTQEAWMECLYAVPHGRTMDGVADWLLGGRLGEDGKHRGKLHFPFSRKLYDEKSAFVQAFAARLRAEGAGELFCAADWDAAYHNHLEHLHNAFGQYDEN